MISDKKSLLSYLTTKNPILDITNCGTGHNTTAYGKLWKEPKRINEWTDFQPDSLASIYDGQLSQVLNTTARYPDPLDIPPVPFLEIHDEDSLECLLMLWTQQIVSNALVVAQDRLDPTCTLGRIYMARGGQAQRLTAYPKDEKKKNSYPDWAGVKRVGKAQKMEPKASNILPGDTKLSTKWNSNTVSLGDSKVFRQNLDTALPVIQVFNYCLKANARYGYIITDQELVVIRVGAIEKTEEQADSKNEGKTQESQEKYASEAQKKARRSGEVEFMSIPWTNHVDQSQALDPGLTVNLALWWLHLMAAVECCIDMSYPKLSDEKFPLAAMSDNISFSNEIAKMNLTPSALADHQNNPAPVGKKRKYDHTPQTDGKNTKRK